jgi:hypothetical protein
MIIEKKILINNFITFILLLSVFLFLNYHINMINGEFQYRNYQACDNIPFEICEDQTFILNIDPIMVILSSLSLISLLNVLYYLLKNYESETKK